MLNKALRLIRVYHDLSLTETANRVGLSKSYISELESEEKKKKVTVDVLEKYAKAFNIPMSSLVLFAERVENQKFSENARAYIANKTLKMLDWIATISADRESDARE